MKSSATTTKCQSRAARRGKSCASAGVHAAPRQRTPAARSASAPHSLDHPAYVELAARPRSVPLAASRSLLPRVLHVDTESGTVLACLLGSEVHVTHVATLGEARALLQQQIFSLVILDPALPDGDAKSLLPLLNGTPLLVYSDKQPEWRDTMPLPFLSKTWTTARQLWTRMSTMLWNTSAVSAGD